VDRDGTERANSDYLRLDAATHRPDPEHARWLVAQMAACGQVASGDDAADRAAALYRPDLFAAAIGG
ncbi:MAG: nitrate transporter, partial [Methylorubrum extorquens]